MIDEERHLRRKGWRVAGMFVFMIGAGVVLESPAVWSGVVVMVGGLIVHGATFMAKTPAGVLAEESREES
jgi:hypothetical protein